MVAYSFVKTGKKKEIIFTDKAPKPIGPYSQAVRNGNTLFVSGNIAVNPQGQLDTSDIKTETMQVLKNISSVLKAAGMGEGDVVKATVYMTNLKDFAAMNEVYAGFFSKGPPARETIEVKALPKGAHVEISVVALGN
jgi:2-iminobutanoate/2-iminopropanoate deaminase